MKDRGDHFPPGWWAIPALPLGLAIWILLTIWALG